MPTHKKNPPTAPEAASDREGAADSTFHRYAADPVAFVTEVLGQRPWEKQAAILRALARDPQVTVRSSHGVGKTWVAAGAALWWVYAHHPALVLTTAPTARQVESLLWAEIQRLWHGARRPLAGRCLQTRLTASRTQTALGLSTNEPERFAGWHSEHLLVIVDEASGVPDSLFEVLQGTLTSAHCRLPLIGNPTRTDGLFFRSHHGAGDGWTKLKISAYDTPNFEGVGGRAWAGAREAGDGSDKGPMLTLPDPTPHALPPIPLPCPWLVTPAWVEQRKKEWGEDSDAFRVRVLGEFPRASADTLIELAWIEAAEAGTHRDAQDEQDGKGSDRKGNPVHPGNPSPAARVPDPVNAEADPERLNPPAVRAPETPERLTPVVFGLDVARFGDCQTALAVRRGDQLWALESWEGADLMETCGRVVQAAREARPRRIVVDAVGLGAGVVDRLRELVREGALEGEIVAFSAGERALDPVQFNSRRDEAFWDLRARHREARITHSRAFSALTGPLSQLRYRFTSRGKIQIESKEELRRRGLPSPDQADAVALAFAPEAAPALCLPLALASCRPIFWPLPPLRG